MQYAQTAAFALLSALSLVACDGGNTKEPPASGAAPSDGSKGASKDKGAAKSDGGVAAKDGAVAEGGGEKVKVVEGSPDDGDERFALTIEPPADAKAGQAGTAVVKIVPRDPWHMNLDYPTSLKLDAPEALAVTKAELKKADAKLDEKGCEFDVEFTPASAGEHEVTGKFKFAVCKDEACAPVTQDVSFKVAVN